MTTRRTPIVFAGAGLLAALAFLGHGILRGEKAEKQTHVIRIEMMAFSPKTLRVAPGDSVTWINHDIVMHAVKSTDRDHAWQSPDLQPKESWTQVVTTPGPYVCPYHPTMTAELVAR